jgi:histidyl-tRNA synthetase
MNELKLFPENTDASTQVLLVNFGGEEEKVCLTMLSKMHKAGISAELYPESAKMKKQFSYADNKHIPYILIIGQEEAKTGIFQLKEMKTGEQLKFTADEIIQKLSK